MFNNSADRNGENTSPITHFYLRVNPAKKPFDAEKLISEFYDLY